MALNAAEIYLFQIRESWKVVNRPPLEYPEIDAKAAGEFLSEHSYQAN